MYLLLITLPLIGSCFAGLSFAQNYFICTIFNMRAKGISFHHYVIIKLGLILR